MPDLNDLFGAASVVGEETDDTDWLVISHDFRTIAIPSNKKLAGVTSDEKVNRISFKCQRYYGEVDLNDFKFRINYTNANGEGDQYLVLDKAISNDEITFSWLVGRHACEYPGYISFIVCAIKTDQNSTIQQEYNTAIHTLQVVQGLETSEEVYEETHDLVDEMYQQFIDASYTINGVKLVGNKTGSDLNLTDKIIILSLSTSWLGTASPYTQRVTINGYTVTSYTKVDLVSDATTIASMERQGVTQLYISNNNGVLTAYAIGNKPTEALTVQAVVNETR